MIIILEMMIVMLNDRRILPDNQSGFRAGHRLQTRVLLLIEQISSYTANSSSVATVFIDFKSAFDQLWFAGCLGKLARLDIPQAYVNWIRFWLEGYSGVIEIQGQSYRWFAIQRGGPQGSSITPSIFITVSGIKHQPFFLYIFSLFFYFYICVYVYRVVFLFTNKRSL
jgi:hypothetical protein